MIEVREKRLVLPLLKRDEIGNQSILGVLSSGDPKRQKVLVDDPENPRAVVVRDGFTYFYAQDLRAARPVIEELRKRKRLECGAVQQRFADRLVARHWEHGGDFEYILWRVKQGPSCAVYQGREPVAWTLTHGDGAMGFLHVLPEHRGKGYARSLTYAMTQRILDLGRLPFLYVLRTNRPSLRLTRSCGFVKHGAYAYFSSDRPAVNLRTTFPPRGRP